MAIITKDPHQWFTVTDDSGNEQTIFSNKQTENDYPFAFECNFSDASKPATNTVTLYNMSKEHSDFYKKKEKCYLAFNWGKEKKIICEGYITKTDTSQTDGVTDTMVIYFTEGTDYNNVKANALKVESSKKVKNYKKVAKTKAGHWENTRTVTGEHVETYTKGKHKGEKHVVKEFKHGVKYVKPKTTYHRVRTKDTKKKVFVNKVYRKGTTYKQLIQGIASQAGIKISKIQLAVNPKLKKSFTATGKPMTLLNQLVKKTKSKLMYEKGKLVIVDPKADKRTWYVIDDQDLIQPPAKNESDDGEEATWEITTPLIPDVTTNVGIVMRSKYLEGRFYVTAGKHTSDGDNPQTQMSLKAL